MPVESAVTKDRETAPRNSTKDAASPIARPYPDLTSARVGRSRIERVMSERVCANCTAVLRYPA